jgi:uncharacterized protein YfiM (DUF2279 family)
MIRKRKHLALILALLSFTTGTAAEEADVSTDRKQGFDKVLATNLAGITFITAWGINNWEYGDRKPHARREHWFGEDTRSGGADKLGHYHMSYVLSHGLAGLFQYWGYQPQRAARLGALSSFAMMSYMEFGDSFSDFGFSYEDFIMNGLGAYTGYYLLRHPDLMRKLDLRIEYRPRSSELDVFTDYNRTKYVAALKLGGFNRFRHHVSQYLELQLGYYTRGYTQTAETNERNIYIGVGINLSRVFSRRGYTGTARVFNYYQVPDIYLDATHDLNRK